MATGRRLCYSIEEPLVPPVSLVLTPASDFAASLILIKLSAEYTAAGRCLFFVHCREQLTLEA